MACWAWQRCSGFGGGAESLVARLKEIRPGSPAIVRNLEKMTRRTILLGLAGSLVSLPLSLGTHPFLSDPEEVAQQLTEWSLQGDLEKLVEVYDPEDVVTFQQVVLATGDLYARHGELPPLAEAGLDPAQARALDPPQFMRKAQALPPKHQVYEAVGGGSRCLGNL